MVKLGNKTPTMYVKNKKSGGKMKINVDNFDPKLHAKIDESAPAKPKAEPKAEPKPKAKAEPKPKPK